MLKNLWKSSAKKKQQQQKQNKTKKERNQKCNNVSVLTSLVIQRGAARGNNAACLVVGHVRQSFRVWTVNLFSITHCGFDFLQDERKLNPATLSNHVNSLLYPLKYKHRACGPYSDVPIIAQLLRASSQLQRQGEMQRPWTVEQLRALNRWLTW